jgi:hypothetical protein
LIAKRLIGYEPTRNIEDYIKGVINETNWNITTKTLRHR